MRLSNGKNWNSLAAYISKLLKKHSPLLYFETGYRSCRIRQILYIESHGFQQLSAYRMSGRSKVVQTGLRDFFLQKTTSQVDHARYFRTTHACRL